MKNVDHCIDKGAMACRYMKEILTVWSGPGGGHSMVVAMKLSSFVNMIFPGNSYKLDEIFGAY